MEQDNHYKEYIDNSKNDISFNWVRTSRFIWLLTVLAALTWSIGGCYNLYQHRYKGHPQVEVPENTKYNPKYK